MSTWLKVRSHFLFRVALGYLVLVWLLALAISVVFPMLGWPTGSTTLAISLLLLGFPIVVFSAWVFGDRQRGNGTSATGEWRRANPLGRKIERALIVVLVIAVTTIGVHQFVIEERVPEVPDRSGGLEPTEGSTGQFGQPRTIPIGILSPKEGSRSSQTGFGHEASIYLAFEELGPIRFGASEIEIQEISFDDTGSEDRAAELALQLAREQGVAAILGPVNSSSTNRVLAALRQENIDIPVISSLSTAPELTSSGSRDRNFFRLIFNDSRRMRDLGKHLEERLGKSDDEKLLLLYEDDTYGRGLRNYLAASLPTLDFDSVAWCEVLEPACSPVPCERGEECVNHALPISIYEGISTAEALNDSWKDRIRSSEFSNIVVLGTVPGSLAFSDGFSRLNPSLLFGFVGSNARLFRDAPNRSMIIGNPVLDPLEAPNFKLTEAWADLLRLFEEKYGQDPSNFVPSAYEAAMVIHNSLSLVLAVRDEVPPLDQLRRNLIETLETEEFDSLEPWRRIRFVEGELLEPPDAPIFSISRGRLREDQGPIERPWVAINVEPRYSYMEGPITVRLEGNFIDSARVVLSRIENGETVFIRDAETFFSGGEATVDFHVFRTGTYRISVAGVAQTPSTVQIEVGLAWTYLVSVCTAFLGALVIVLREPASFRDRAVRVFLGVFAGFSLTFSALYGSDLAGWFPFPRFGDEPYINAIVTGLIGGLVGPYVLVEVFLSWALTLSLGRSRDDRPREIPEGL